MAVTATKREISKNGFNVVATVDFVDDATGEKITESIPANDLSEQSLAFRCQRIVELIETRNAAFAAIQPGPVVLPRDAKAGPLADAVTAQAATADFFDKLAALSALKAQAAKGIIDAADPSIGSAEAAMKSAFLPEYASDPRFR